MAGIRNAYDSPSCDEQAENGARARSTRAVCPAGWCDICDDRRDLQYRNREDTD